RFHTARGRAGDCAGRYARGCGGSRAGTMRTALALIALTAFLYLLGPILVIVGSALGSTNYLAFPPHGLTLKWFAAALSHPRYLSAFLSSLQIAVAAMAGALLLGLPAAYALA